jgi:twitching motility protein PilT
MAKLDELFKMMVSQGASDLHITTGSPPQLRLHGDMHAMEFKPLTAEECQGLIFEILSDRNKKQFIENWELDCVYELQGVGRFRCNVFMQRKGIGAVFRHIPTKILTVKDLNLPQNLVDMVSTPKGLVLVTGPTGSGKSTTLAALIDHLNSTEPLHILTIEDPIEFTHENKLSLVNQREVGGHTKSFAKALKAALREDPDIILVGEMRDIETISLAITAAETGHLVFGTLHTMNAPKTVDRVIDVFPEDRQAQIRTMLSESLRGVIAQTLLPKKGGGGRVAAYEVLFNTKAVANLIREGKTFQIPSSMQTGRAEGMMTFKDHIDQLIAEGKIERDVGYAFLGRASAKEEAPPAATGPAPAATATPQPAGASKFVNPFKKSG